MISTAFSLENASVPDEVKVKLKQMAQSISFSRYDQKGNNGYVFFGVNRLTKVNVAVKVYYWGGEAGHAEPHQLAQISSPNVLRILDAGLVDFTWAYFVTPECSKGDLDDLIEKTSIGNVKALDITYQVLSGLSYLHAEQFVHRDIKPSNIYLESSARVVIGDFGSVKKIVDAGGGVPASSHSDLFRPPEAIGQKKVGTLGDIYQTGILLYQLLGGYLSYQGEAYFSKKQRAAYDRLTGPDQSLFVKQLLGDKIVAGKLIDIDTLPPWVPKVLRKIVARATHLDPSKRFSSATAFMKALHDVRPQIPDWEVIDGTPILKTKKVSYRIIGGPDEWTAQKKGWGNWRNDSSMGTGTLHDLVERIESAVF
jgi:serine/threonine protein kinase